MQETDRSATSRRRSLGRARWVGAGLAVTVVALGAGLVATALPAYADVTSTAYTIGTPTGGVTAIAASPTSVTTNASTQFKVTFTTPAALAGSSDSWVTVTPSESLVSSPSSIALVGGSCIQAGTSGAGGAGIDTTTTVTIELGSTCAISAGDSVEVIYTADAPSTTSTFTFTITTSSDTYPTTSNEIAVSTSGSSLTASTRFRSALTLPTPSTTCRWRTSPRARPPSRWWQTQPLEQRRSTFTTGRRATP